MCCRWVYEYLWSQTYYTPTTSVDSLFYLIKEIDLILYYTTHVYTHIRIFTYTNLLIYVYTTTESIFIYFANTNLRCDPTATRNFAFVESMA